MVHADTKLFVDHSDAFAGTISTTEAAWPEVESTHALLGFCTSGDDTFLVACGLHTLGFRMKEHQARALEITS